MPVRALDERPVPTPAVRWYMEAFESLSHSRFDLNTGKHQPVALTEIEAYLGIIGESNAEKRYRFTRHIQQMDVVYLRHQAKAAK